MSVPDEVVAEMLAATEQRGRRLAAEDVAEEINMVLEGLHDTQTLLSLLGRLPLIAASGRVDNPPRG